MIGHDPQCEDSFDSLAICPRCGDEDTYSFHFCTCCPSAPLTTCASCGAEFTYEGPECAVAS